MPTVDVWVRGLDEFLAQVPAWQRPSPGVLCRLIIAEHLRDLQRVRSGQQQQLVGAFYGRLRAYAAEWCERLRGEADFDDLLAVAIDEASKGAARYDQRKLGDAGPGAAWPYLKKWAGFGIKRWLRERREEEAQTVRPDEDARWERIGGAAEEADPELRAALEGALEGLGRKNKAIGRRVLQGLDDDEVAAQVRVEVAVVVHVREVLRQRLGGGDEELTQAEAAEMVGVTTKQIYKAVETGKLPRWKRDGKLVLRASEVRAWHRQRGR